MNLMKKLYKGVSIMNEDNQESKELGFCELDMKSLEMDFNKFTADDCYLDVGI